MIKIKLTPAEFVRAATIGVKKIAWAKQGGAADNSDVIGPKAYGQQIAGFIGEYAICKYLGAFWDYNNNDRGKDGKFAKNDIPGFSRPIDVKTRFISPKIIDRVFIASSTPKESYKEFDFIFCNYWDFTIYILGYMPSEEFFGVANLDYLGEGHKKKNWVLKDLSKL